MNSESRQQGSEELEERAPEARRPSLKLLVGQLFFSFARFLALVLPPPVFVSLGRRIGRWTSYACPREMSFALAQLRFVGIEGEHRPIARAAFGHIGEAISEIILYRKLITKKPELDERGIVQLEYIDAIGTEVVTDLLAAGKPAVALSAHFGCVELLAGYFVSIGAKMSVVTRVPHYQHMAELFRQHRKIFGIETLWKGDIRSSMKMLRQLKAGGVVAGLVDQDMDEENVFSEFFGVPCATPVGLVRVAIKYNLAILTSFIVRTGPFHHKVVTELIDWQRFERAADGTQLSDHQLQVMILDEYHRRLASLIREHPEQWVWWHRRWRRRPGEDPKKPKSSAMYLDWLKEYGERNGLE